MPEPIPASNDASSGTAAPEPKTQAAPPPVTTGTETVTREELNAVLKRVDGQSAVLSRLEKSLERMAPAPSPAPANTGTPSLDERVKTLEHKQEQLNAREQKQGAREVDHQLKTALVAGGVDASQAPRFAKLVALEHAANIVVDYETMSVQVKDGDAMTPVDKWVTAYLQTDAGKVFLPPKQTPQINNSRNPLMGAAPSKRKVTRADLAAGLVTTDEIRKGTAEVID